MFYWIKLLLFAYAMHTDADAFLIASVFVLIWFIVTVSLIFYLNKRFLRQLELGVLCCMNVDAFINLSTDCYRWGFPVKLRVTERLQKFPIVLGLAAS